jgi:hypothetical protein
LLFKLLLSSKLTLYLLTKLLIIICNFDFEFCDPKSQITNMSCKLINLCLLVHLLHYCFFSYLGQLLSRAVDLFSISFAGFVGHCTIFFVSYTYSSFIVRSYPFLHPLSWLTIIFTSFSVIWALFIQALNFYNESIYIYFKHSALTALCFNPLWPYPISLSNH